MNEKSFIRIPIAVIIVVVIGVVGFFAFNRKSEVPNLNQNQSTSIVLQTAANLCGKLVNEFSNQYSNIKIRTITECTNNKGEIFLRAILSATDHPDYFYNSSGKFILSCGGMPAPGGVLRELDKQCAEFEKNLTCDSPEDLCMGVPLNTNLPANDNQVQASTAPNDTTNWQTYRNDKYGFEFKYPRDVFA